MSLPYTDNVNVLSATAVTVANTAALTYDVSKRQKNSIQFNTIIVGGTATFGMEVSNDMTNWVVYNRLIANSAGTSVTYSSAPAVATAGTNSYIYFIPDYFRALRVFVTVAGTVTSAAAVLQSAG